MAVHCAGCSTTAGIAGCPEHGSNTYTPPLIGVNDFITNCRHGIDLRFVPRCYLCRPAESGETIWQVTPSGHVHKGEWCEMCVAHGRAALTPAPDAPRPVMTLHTCWDDHEGEDGGHADGSPCRDKATPLYAQPAPDALRVAAQAVIEVMNPDDCETYTFPETTALAALRAALADPDRPLTRDEMLRYRVQHDTRTGLHPDARDILEDQPPVPGGTTAIRDGKYVTEKRAPEDQ